MGTGQSNGLIVLRCTLACTLHQQGIHTFADCGLVGLQRVLRAHGIAWTRLVIATCLQLGPNAITDLLRNHDNKTTPKNNCTAHSSTRNNIARWCLQLTTSSGYFCFAVGASVNKAHMHAAMPVHPAAPRQQLLASKLHAAHIHSSRGCFTRKSNPENLASHAFPATGTAVP
jgi:hypothetical protein